MPRKRKHSTPTFRRPLPFVSSPLQASPRNPPSPLKKNISPPEARSVPIDCLSETEYLILPCSQLTSATSSALSTRSKRRSPRLQDSASSVASARIRGGGGRGKKKTPPTNKAPVVSLVGDEDSASRKGSRFDENRRRTMTGSYDHAGQGAEEPAFANNRQDATKHNRSEVSPDMLLNVKRRSSNGQIHSRRENAENVDFHKDDNFLHSRNLSKTPPSRKSRRRTSSPNPSSPQLPLANVINTPNFVADLRHTAVAEAVGRDSDAVVSADEDIVIPDTYPTAEKEDSAEAEATFLTPQRKYPVSLVLAPETPVAEMGLTYVEKSAIARRRLREARHNQEAA